MISNNFIEVPSSTTGFSFKNSVKILLEKPHVVNKRLWGSKTLFRKTFKSTVPITLPEKIKIIKNIDHVHEYGILLCEDLNLKTCSKSEIPNIEIILIELLPKTYEENHAFQIIVLQEDNNSATFYDVTPEFQKQILCPTFYYCFKLNDGCLQLAAKCDPSNKSFDWLKNDVQPHLVKWAGENFSSDKQLCNESLALVSPDKYYYKYNELKKKYGKDMVEIWPECTDPTKFVYEDVAIATYLLLLWEEERKVHNLTKYQSFVDLGCGNGLLVYILTKEGHHGLGLDVRCRQIWSLYSEDIKLEVKTISPSDVHLFPETDWLIGNHSDELTPWIPIIAARSSFKCNFFLLPCCAYNFDGSKYQRQDSSVSQYTEYLQYIKQLCEDCGFQTYIDRLKIPSTKRICLVGRGRTYNIEDYNQNCDRIQHFINADCSSTSESGNSSWVKDFKARESKEIVRNCTQLDKGLVENIVKTISKHLLGYCNFESVWSVGKEVELTELVQLIPQEKLKALKSECGGLQTLLKNNHHIFKVQSGKVQLRYPKTIDEVQYNSKNKEKSNKVKIQQKPCWFYNNHPQGCPLTDAKCSFIHTKK